MGLRHRFERPQRESIDTGKIGNHGNHSNRLLYNITVSYTILQ